MALTKPSSPTQQNSTAFVVGVVTGLALAALGIGRAALQYNRTATYAPTAAIVVESHVGPFRHSYIPSITYRYTVDGRTYQSDQYYPVISEASSQEWAAGVCALYPPGASVTAYYSPADPSSAFLHPDGYMTHALTVLIGLAMVAFVAAMRLRRRP